ncbi:MAG: DNA alkylation repair protein [Spirochaetota bacterium]
MKRLMALKSTKDMARMARVGMRMENALGISLYDIRDLARSIKPDHALAARLWASRYNEARILAGMIDEKDKVTDAQLESWVHDFDSWEICDQTCDNLISDSRFAYKKAVAWAARKEEFVRRAGFTLMAMIGWYGKGYSDARIKKFLPIVVRYADDERNFVKKAVNWALRNIGKGRSIALHTAALRTAKILARSDSKSARWIGKDAIRELTSKKKIDRLRVIEAKRKAR